MIYPQLINDPRLDGYTQRVRSGSNQIFYLGNDWRDFDRYSAKNGPSTYKPDTINLKPPEKHIYA